MKRLSFILISLLLVGCQLETDTEGVGNVETKENIETVESDVKTAESISSDKLSISALEDDESSVKEMNVDDADIETADEGIDLDSIDFEEIDYYTRVGGLDGDSANIYTVWDEDYIYYYFDLYVGNEVIYRHEDDTPVRLEYKTASYIDLDHDGEDEVFLKFYPKVNSFLATEYVVIKNIDGVWTKLEVYEGEKKVRNAFPIHIVRGEGEYEACIYCEGLEDKPVSFDMKSAYDYRVYDRNTLLEENSSSGASVEATNIVDNYENEVFPKAVGEEIGSLWGWGVLGIYESTYEGQPCLVAYQGVEGYSRWDKWGEVYIAFDYDQEGKIHPLEIRFKPEY